MARTVSERLGSFDELLRITKDEVSSNLRSAIPGIIKNFNSTTQTAEVQVAIREKVRDISLNETWVNIPLLLDVPIVMPRAGGYILAMPVEAGDECLVVFGDMCIDAWWSNGGVQNQIEKRRHDLSDAFAILGAWSQPRKISNYPTDAAQLRTEDGNTYIELKDGEINLVAASVKINSQEFSTHTHSGVTTGSGDTGGVN